jgi:diguanylate cyclase (GGDEF)-like protein
MDTGQRYRDRRAMWLASLAMCLTGAATILAILPVPDPDASDHEELAIVGASQALVALAVWRGGPNSRLVRATPLIGIVLVSAITALARPIGASPFFYLWPILAAAYFYDRRSLAWALGTFYLTFGGALALFSPPESRMMLFVGGASSFTLAAVLVRALRERLDGTVAELRRTAATDPLTGLLNRRGFEVAFARDIERARRSEVPLTVVVLDLDWFKQVNDRFGHAAGDEALVAIAEILRAENRGGDAVARIGGEEFAAVLLDADADGAIRYAERVAAAAAANATTAGPLSLSVGIAELGSQLRTREALLLAADRALYGAKDAGRARVALHGD